MNVNKAGKGKDEEPCVSKQDQTARAKFKSNAHSKEKVQKQNVPGRFRSLETFSSKEELKPQERKILILC